MALLDAQLRRLLDRLSLGVRARSTAARHGGHRSPVLASGLELADHRAYAPGDDVRRVDWKAFARHRQLSIRQFEEDRDARIYVLLDVSASMSRGEPAKLEVARKVAAAIGYVGMRQFDRVHVVPFASSAARVSRAFDCAELLPALERFVLEASADGVTRFEDVARALGAKLAARGHVVVVTDLMAPSGWEDGIEHLAHRGHDVRLVRLSCRDDDAPDARGEIELDDVETGERLRLRADAKLLDAYRAVVRAHVDRVRSAVRGAGGRFVEAPVEAPIEKVVRAALSARSVAEGAR